MLGEAVVKVRRDQAWRFNGGMGENQDSTGQNSIGRTKQRIMLIQ